MLYARFIIEQPPEDSTRGGATLQPHLESVSFVRPLPMAVCSTNNHGIGLKLGRLMKELYGPAFAVVEKIKDVLDPNNIMNPGKMGLRGFR